MAGCSITEFRGFGKDSDGDKLDGIPGPIVTAQAVTYTVSAQSAAFNGATNMVRIIADAAVFIAFGANPTADANSLRIPSDTVEYFSVNPGDKVACYDGIS